MNMRAIPALALLALGGAVSAAALAQDPASVNPAVDTSAAADAHPGSAPPTAPAVPALAPAAPASASAPAARVPDAAATPSAQATPARRPAADADAAAAAREPAASPPAGAAADSPGSSDRIELGTTEISGNRELPRLMYIVPWQRAQVGKITGRPPNSLVDEALTPVDRSVFERQNSYYAALQAASASAASQPAPPGAPAAAVAPRDEK